MKLETIALSNSHHFLHQPLRPVLFWRYSRSFEEWRFRHLTCRGLCLSFVPPKCSSFSSAYSFGHFYLLRVHSDHLGRAWSGLLNPFFGRRNSKKYVLWNLQAQTFKQNAQYITFFGPGDIKCPNENGCQGRDCHFYRGRQGSNSVVLHTSEDQLLRRGDSLGDPTTGREAEAPAEAIY
jgi:hypothetical protein